MVGGGGGGCQCLPPHVRLCAIGQPNPQIVIGKEDVVMMTTSTSLGRAMSESRTTVSIVMTTRRMWCRGGRTTTRSDRDRCIAADSNDKDNDGQDDGSKIIIIIN